MDLDRFSQPLYSERKTKRYDVDYLEESKRKAEEDMAEEETEDDKD